MIRSGSAITLRDVAKGIESMIFVNCLYDYQICSVKYRSSKVHVTGVFGERNFVPVSPDVSVSPASESISTRLPTSGAAMESPVCRLAVPDTLAIPSHPRRWRHRNGFRCRALLPTFGACKSRGKLCWSRP